MTDRSRWRWLTLVLFVFAALTLVACGDDEGDGGTAAQEFPAGTTMAELQDRGEIRIGVKYDVPPFGLLNPQT
jgi:glutamate transport system substrate-binding protein